MQGGVKTSASFSADGKWMATEKEMDPAQMPEVVRRAIARGYSGYATKERSPWRHPMEPAMKWN
jgi:hypothetical protein